MLWNKHYKSIATIKLNTEVSADDPILEKADRIFVATGSAPFVPPISGVEGKNVIGVIDAHESGVSGDTIAICGGGMSGCDTAIELAMEGKTVLIIEMRDQVASDVMPINKISIMNKLAEHNIELLTNRKVVSIDEKGVTVEDKSGEKQRVIADTVITAFGQKPAATFPDAIRAKYNIKTTVIGDAEKVSRAGSAIRSGFYAAMSVE